MPVDAFIYDAIRTPRGKGKASGALHEVKPISLVVGLLNALKERNALDTSRVDDVVMGCVSPLNDQGSVLPRFAVLAADWSQSVAGVQLNRFCASGLEAVNMAAMKVASGWEDLVVAGGVESMSRVPMGSDGGAWSDDPETNFKTGFVPQGVGADLIATLEGFSRDDVDGFALRSQQKAAHAAASGYFSRSLVPVRDINGLAVLDQDEYIRADTTLAGLATLKPAFKSLGDAGLEAVVKMRYPMVESINYVHTAGNSSGIVDGAALVLIGNSQVGKELGLKPRARIVATAVVGSEPTIMLTGPVPATEKVLAKAGLKIDDIDLFELNEAFASVVMRFQKHLGVTDEKMNVNGGAIAMGHPLGATGAMILGTCLDELERRKKRFGLVTLCVGGGMGIATIIERV
ncbi:MAG: acetyl-CoA C-acetyltransferase [Steroidobacteraceae bacterium]